MAHSKSLGIGAMVVLLIIAVSLLPMIVRYVNRMEPHFVDGFSAVPEAYSEEYNAEEFRNYMTPMDLVEDSADQGVTDVPAIGRTSQLPSWRPDLNTNYLCRSPNESGVPCPEGQFCDGTTQGCVPVAMFGDPNKNYVGYFS
jgi:hypothetical protein